MTRAVAPHIADSLCEIWSTLHQGENFSFLRDERHYLQQIVLSADCDLVSGLLSRKLRIAKVWNAQLIPSDVVTMNSCIEYYHGSARLPRFCQLVHPSDMCKKVPTLSISSLLGAGLIGVRNGQSILWPDENHRLAELAVLHVENRHVRRDARP